MTSKNVENSVDENPEEEEVLGSITQSIDSSKRERPFHIQLRTSARVSKKLRLDSEAQEKKKEDKVEVKPAETKPKRHELWSTEDKNAFFEALNEYGKDFDSIQAYMNSKRRKRGHPGITKNRDQARHFYYRTWNKIAKYIKFPPDVKKVTQELYGLINFGEFKKKAGFFNKKSTSKLNELIYSGTTQVRVKGKTIRVKTPVCRALKRLHNLDDGVEDMKVPTKIVIELKPRDNHTRFRIKAMTMNSRIRTVMPLNRRIGSLIEYLQMKWKTTDNPPLDNNDKAPQSLRVAPKEGLKIYIPAVSAGEFISSSRISLLAYEKKYGSSESTSEDMLKQLNLVGRSGKGSKYVRKQQIECEKNSKLNQNNEAQLVAAAQPDVPYTTAREFLESRGGQAASKSALLGRKKDKEDDVKLKSAEKDQEIVSRAKSGWSAENCETIRIGDLYLMFGNESKLQLEYWWDDPTVIESEIKVTFDPQSLVPPAVKDLLEKLLEFAKSFHKRSRIKPTCTCGHVCTPNGTNTGGNVSSTVNSGTKGHSPRGTKQARTPKSAVDREQKNSTHSAASGSRTPASKSSMPASTTRTPTSVPPQAAAHSSSPRNPAHAGHKPHSTRNRKHARHKSPHTPRKSHIEHKSSRRPKHKKSRSANKSPQSSVHKPASSSSHKPKSAPSTHKRVHTLLKSEQTSSQSSVHKSTSSSHKPKSAPSAQKPVHTLQKNEQSSVHKSTSSSHKPKSAPSAQKPVHALQKPEQTINQNVQSMESTSTQCFTAPVCPSATDMMPPPRVGPATFGSFREQINKLQLRCTSRRGRDRQKIVQRMLPVYPRIPGTTQETRPQSRNTFCYTRGGNISQSHAAVFIPISASPESNFVSVTPNVAIGERKVFPVIPQSRQMPPHQVPVLLPASTTSSLSSFFSSSTSSGSSLEPPTTPSSISTSISDAELLFQDEGSRCSTSTFTRFLELEEAFNVKKGEEEPSGLHTPRFPSPTKECIKSGRISPQWIYSEASSKSSLSSLLQQLDNTAEQLKNRSSSSNSNASSILNTDVNTQFQELIEESSVDYVEKFNKIAAEIAAQSQVKLGN